MKITKRQLRRIIKEELDIINNETGQVFEFGDEPLSSHTPEAAWPELAKRLGIKSLQDDLDDDAIYVSGEDWDKLDNEVMGKRNDRNRKRAYKEREAERARLNIDNLKARLDQWADDAGADYSADNPGVDMQSIAWDLASGAKYSFAPDEWDELVWEFDDSEDDLITYIAEMI